MDLVPCYGLVGPSAISWRLESDIIAIRGFAFGYIEVVEAPVCTEARC